MKISMKRVWPVVALCCTLLVACGPGTRTVTLTLDKVTLPASVAASADLKVELNVWYGGCSSFQDILAERTASALRLSIRGSEPAGFVACPAVISSHAMTYTDPGTASRSDPFEVFVNGKSYGTVAIRERHWPPSTPSESARHSLRPGLRLLG